MWLVAIRLVQEKHPMAKTLHTNTGEFTPWGFRNVDFNIVSLCYKI